MDATPFVDREIDHGKSGGREFLSQAFTQFHIAGSYQQLGRFLQTGVVTDDEQRVRCIVLGSDDR